MNVLIQLFLPLYWTGKSMKPEDSKLRLRSIKACPDELIRDAIRLLEKYPDLGASPRSARRLAKLKAEQERRKRKRRGRDSI